MRRLFGICLLVAVCGVMGVPAYYLYERFQGKRAWDAYAAEAKQRGVKLDLAEYLPPKITDAENFASIPVFEAVFRASDHGQESPNPFALPPRKTGEVPKLSNPNKQTPIDLTAWQKYFVEVKLLPSASDNAAVDVLKALDHFAEPLAQLHEAGMRKKCRFPVHYELGPGASLPHMALLQDASKLYGLRIAAHLSLGSPGEAYADWREGLRLSTAIIDEPSAIAGLVRIAVTVVMIDAVWDGLEAHRWLPAELQKIESDLGALDWLNDYVFMMGSERGEANLITEMVIQRPHILDDLFRKNDTVSNQLLSVYPVGWFYQSQVRMNHFFDEQVARIDPTQRRLFSDRSVPSSPENISDTSERIRCALFAVLAPVMEQMESKFVHAASFTDEARLACALELSRMAHGHFPSSLAELAPEFISEVPVEIVNGEPYHYRLTDDGSFVLYSVGTDLRDDGGAIDPKLSASKQRDWVWRYPAK